jgi:hypothetical protein
MTEELGVTGLVSCINHETKPKSLPVIAAMPFALGDSHHYHLIFFSMKKSFTTSNAALPLAFPFTTYKIKYTQNFYIIWNSYKHH